MSSVYELFLRAPGDGTMDAAALEEQLAERLPAGVRGEVFTEPDAPPSVARGVDLALEEGASLSLLLDAAFPLAEELELEVFDPQLGETITGVARERVSDRYEEICRYRSGTLGDSLVPSVPATASTAARVRLNLWLVVGGILVAFILLARGCHCLM